MTETNHNKEQPKLNVAGVAPLAEDIAERWRGLVRNGSSGLDVSAARNGLQPKAHPGRFVCASMKIPRRHGFSIPSRT
jgi:hypothetical protein